MTHLRHSRHPRAAALVYSAGAMFDAFETPADLSDARKRVTVAFVAASVVLGAFVVLVAFISASRPLTELKAPQVDVSFRPPPPPPPPEPVRVEAPPRPRVARPPPPPAATPPPVAAPVAAPAPAAAPLTAPKALPLEKPPEADVATAAIAVAVGGTGDGSGTAVGTNDADESAAPAVAKAGSSGPINLPEDAEPPEPSEDNAAPEYPESARLTGQEARVVLKVVVELDGRVGRVQVLKGEEPFVSAALAVVRTWTYSPATLEGAPISVFKIVNVTFSLRN